MWQVILHWLERIRACLAYEGDPVGEGCDTMKVPNIDEAWVNRWIPIGSRWRHYKSGKYVVTGYSRCSETAEILVLYKHPDDLPETLPWSRPAKEWFQNVGYLSGGVPLPRFEVTP